MYPSDKITISQQVVARQVGHETVVLHLGRGTYFGLDPVGARIWQLMNECKPLSEIWEIMLEEYDVSREDLERDSMKLIEDLLAQGLICPS